MEFLSLKGGCTGSAENATLLEITYRRSIMLLSKNKSHPLAAMLVADQVGFILLEDGHLVDMSVKFCSIMVLEMFANFHYVQE